MRLVIRIDNQIADMPANEDFIPEIIKRFIDFTDPFAVVGDYTIGLKLPSTSRNRSILLNIGDINVNSDVFRYKHTASIELDEVTLIKGQLQIIQASNILIECTLTGDNIAWGSLFEGKSLRSVDLGSVPYTGFRSESLYPNINQTLGTITALDVWKTNEEDGIYTFNIPLIAYGNFPITISDDDDPTTNYFVGNPLAYQDNPITPSLKFKDSGGYIEAGLLPNTQIDSLYSLDSFPFAPYL